MKKLFSPSFEDVWRTPVIS